jgi:hypothetical protein
LTRSCRCLLAVEPAHRVYFLPPFNPQTPRRTCSNSRPRSSEDNE